MIRISVTNQMIRKMVMMMLTMIMMMMVRVMVELERKLGPMSWWESVFSHQYVFGFSKAYVKIKLGHCVLNTPMVSEVEKCAFFIYKKSLCVNNHRVYRK